MFRTAVLSLFFVLVAASVALAHRVTIFAYGEGDAIVAEGGFPGGNPAKDCPIEVYDAASGEKLLEGNSGDSGVFRFPVDERIRAAASGLNVVIVAGEGHKGEWFLEPEEYGADAGNPDAEQPAEAVGSDDGQGVSAGPTLGAGFDEARLEALVERAVDRKLAPIKRKLLEEDGPSVSEIVGGIGYLVGLAGIAAWARSRRERRP